MHSEHSDGGEGRGHPHARQATRAPFAFSQVQHLLGLKSLPWIGHDGGGSGVFTDGSCVKCMGHMSRSGRASRSQSS